MRIIQNPIGVAVLSGLTAVLYISLLCLLLPVATAQTVLYQGFLTSTEGMPVDGTAQINMRIHDAEVAGTQVWQEHHAAAPVNDGVFSIDLGLQTPFPQELFNNESLWLEVEINGETLAPRSKLAGFPFSQRAGISESLIDDAIETTMIGDGQVTPAKLAEVCVEGEVLVMLPGGWGCGPGPCLPAAEICDGMDNDCDGVADNGVCTERGEIEK